VMRIETNSAPVVLAAKKALRRIPKDKLRTIQLFVCALCARRDYQFCGFGFDLDYASAMLAPRWKDLSSSSYEAQIIVILPIFRLFSAWAQIAIMAHEFAHASRGHMIGEGWCEKMQRRYRQEERLADSIAAGWGFDKELKVLRGEREDIVNPILDQRGPMLRRRAHMLYAKGQEAMRAGLA
jgi:hypothetical protein